jgi:hypothetical protein
MEATKRQILLYCIVLAAAAVPGCPLRRRVAAQQRHAGADDHVSGCGCAARVRVSAGGRPRNDLLILDFISVHRFASF